MPGHKFPLPLMPGSDIAGVIEALGAGASDRARELGIEVGRRVIVNPGLSCGRCEACFQALTLFAPRADSWARHRRRLYRPRGCSRPEPDRTAGWSISRSSRFPADRLRHGLDNAPGRPSQARRDDPDPGGRRGVSVAAIQMAKLVGATVLTTVGTPKRPSRSEPSARTTSSFTAPSPSGRAQEGAPLDREAGL